MSEHDHFYRVTVRSDAFHEIHLSPEIIDSFNRQGGALEDGLSWCQCRGSNDPVEYFENGECQCVVYKHHYHCGVCGRLLQIG